MSTSPSEPFVCRDCEQPKPISEFYARPAISRGHFHYCKECHNRRRRHDHLRRKFNITPHDYEEMFAAQNGACAMCLQACRRGTRLAIDHDHTTNEVRGLLCRGCNTSLGSLKDSPVMLAQGLRYLADHGKALTTDQLGAILGLEVNQSGDPRNDNADSGLRD